MAAKIKVKVAPLACPKCGFRISDQKVKQRAAALVNARRKTRAGGRPPELEPCVSCGAPLSSRQRRLAACPRCGKRPVS